MTRTTKSESLSQIISCDISGIVKEPFTSVPSLVVPTQDNVIRISKMVISLHVDKYQYDKPSKAINVAK